MVVKWLSRLGCAAKRPLEWPPYRQATAVPQAIEHVRHIVGAFMRVGSYSGPPARTEPVIVCRANVMRMTENCIFIVFAIFSDGSFKGFFLNPIGYLQVTHAGLRQPKPTGVHTMGFSLLLPTRESFAMPLPRSALTPQHAVSRVASFGHALRGVKVLLRQPNARIHAVAAVLVVALGAWWRIAASEWLAVVLAVVLVIGAEALNTALELVVDLVSPEWHALARDAKDTAAAAVLVCSVGAAVVGAVVFGPRLLGLLGWV